MDLTDFIIRVATTYDRRDGVGTPTQALLRRANQELVEHVPGGFKIIGSGGKGFATFSPWVGVFDPDETDSPQRGIYVVYLFAEDLKTVTLSINQGITEPERTLGSSAAAREQLAADARAIRAHIRLKEVSLEQNMSLASRGGRQRSYEAGNILSKTYRLEDLPGEEMLRADLARFLRLYQLATTAKREILVTLPGAVTGRSELIEPAPLYNPLQDFKPKDDGDYVSYIQGRRLLKSRRHERLIAEYGNWLKVRGWRPSTAEHPKDLVLYRPPRGAWIVEAKVVRQGNATDAVRAALGQLYTYRHFLPSDPDTRLLALFSEPVGDAFIRFLEQCDITSVWKSGSTWVGAQDAVDAGIAQSAVGD